MAAINDLINQIQDPALRERIQKEVNKLAKQKKFGLVFEEHMPECTPLYDMPVKAGATVAKKAGQVNDIYQVIRIEDGMATC
ncbi:MAG: site-specific DNA-methyltransferase, partial [Ruminococcaceae bacterium]|nr:site-specific DNA-methyltransferase [Oscillospiraceae bacterium]